MDAEDTDKARKDFIRAVRPLMKWLSDNHHPHMRAIVNYAEAYLVEDQTFYPTEDFVKD